MADKNDWRIRNQQNYLMGVTLHWRGYKQPREGWNHDHCEFCWVRFMEIVGDEIINEGYTTGESDKCYWICKECFKDFKEMFQWKLGYGS